MAVATSYLTEAVSWKKNANNAIYPYAATINGHKCLIRINDFPDNPLYTLISDGRELESFDEWPEHWKRPTSTEVQPRRRKPALR